MKSFWLELAIEACYVVEQVNGLNHVCWSQNGTHLCLFPTASILDCFGMCKVVELLGDL
jgi:hypothetical protein